jgi:hypothetical protein
MGILVRRRREVDAAAVGSVVGDGAGDRSGWRHAHGAARQGGKSLVWEDLPDGPRPVPPGAAAPIPRRPDGTVTREGAAALGRRSAELRKLPDFADGATPWLPPCAELAPFDEARRDLLRQRRAELATTTGGVSSGVGAVLRGWAYLHAAAEYWASKFFATGDRDAFDSMVRAFKAASSEEAKARDAAAWEAKSRPPDLPWWPAMASGCPADASGSVHDQSSVRGDGRSRSEPP